MALGCDGLNGLNLSTLGFDRKHKAGVDGSPVKEDRAGAAVSVIAALLGAGEGERVPEYLKEALAGFTEKLNGLSIDCRTDVYFFTH